VCGASACSLSSFESTPPQWIDVLRHWDGEVALAGDTTVTAAPGAVARREARKRQLLAES